MKKILDYVNTDERWETLELIVRGGNEVIVHRVTLFPSGFTVPPREYPRSVRGAAHLFDAFDTAFPPEKPAPKKPAPKRPKK